MARREDFIPKGLIQKDFPQLDKPIWEGSIILDIEK